MVVSTMASYTKQSPASDQKAALEAELRRLEAELERKRLEEEIRAIESQLQASNVENAQQEEQETYEEEIYEEEILDEEYEEYEEYEEEILEDEETKPLDSSVIKPRKKWTGRSKPSPPPSAFPQSTKTRFVPKIKTNNAFTQNLAAKQASSEEAEKEKAARAAAANEKHLKVIAPPDEDAGPLPDLSPFKPRVIPKIPASSAGMEIPVERLLGPKLYKQGKLVATTTTSGVHGMDLLLLYFGDSWNRDCKDFIPLLYDFYVIASEEGKFDCVYVSQDRSMDHFKSCFQKMPYLAMPPMTAELKNAMSRGFKLVDLPSLVVLDAQSGLVVSVNGVKEIQALKRRDIEQCKQLVQTWKSLTPMTMDEVPMDATLKHGSMERGFLYWQN